MLFFAEGSYLVFGVGDGASPNFLVWNSSGSDRRRARRLLREAMRVIGRPLLYRIAHCVFYAVVLKAVLVGVLRII